MKRGFEFTDFQWLTEPEAAERLKRDGYNELPSARKRSVLRIAFDVIKEPMFLLLIGGGILYFILGDVQEAIMLLSFVVVIMGITFYQEKKTERALEALRDLSSPRAMVIRDGQERRIAGREVVQGDLLLLKEGDRVPADGVVVWSSNLAIDESLLTGESAPVRKSADGSCDTMLRPGGDDIPCIYSGTLVVQGQGLAQVLATGTKTELGKIGKSLRELESQPTKLQQETRVIVRDVAIIGVCLCLLVVVFYGITRSNWLEGVLAGIALAMALLPEEFPVVLTVFLALGAWRISKQQVLTRRVPAIEMLGSATVLCVDKTGTLTENRMTVGQLAVDGKVWDSTANREELPEHFHELLEYSILASQVDPFDPMEKAINRIGDQYLTQTEHLHWDWQVEQEYPLSKSLLAMSRVWKSPVGEEYVIAAKGAPEAIADLCHFSQAQVEALNITVEGMANDGLRVLGVSKARFKQRVLPSEQHDFKFEFIGLVGLIDPLRPSVAEAVEECYDAGIRVIMITGDYPGTAKTIGRQMGLRDINQVITGVELDQLTEEQLRQRISAVTIFARVVPEQKLRIVNALKANGEIVSMTGDGVNDAPALKSAHIGIAMGSRGTDVARESADLVLLDDRFQSIVAAVRLGRRIFTNIRNAMSYILAIHVPIAGMSLIPVIMRWPLVLLPVHIVFLELIIDPACSIVFEAEREAVGIMKRPPRRADSPLFSRKLVGLSLLQGLSVLAIVLTVFCLAQYLGRDLAESRAFTFTTLVIANLTLIFSNRSWTQTLFATLRRRNDALWWVTGSTLGVLALVLYVPALRNLFNFAIMHPSDLGICFIAGFLGILWFEGLKAIKSSRRIKKLLLPSE